MSPSSVLQPELDYWDRSLQNSRVTWQPWMLFEILSTLPSMKIWISPDILNYMYLKLQLEAKEASDGELWKLLTYHWSFMVICNTASSLYAGKHCLASCERGLGLKERWELLLSQVAVLIAWKPTTSPRIAPARESVINVTNAIISQYMNSTCQPPLSYKNQLKYL